MSARPPGPLRLCAKVIADVVSFKVWVPSGEPEPRWTDAAHGGPVTLPKTERAAGHAGWYVGHLGASDEAVFDGLATWAYRTPNPSGTTTTTTTLPTNTTTTTADSGAASLPASEAGSGQLIVSAQG